MTVPDMIIDKLKNYEYEKCGCGGAVGDIYALIHHIAALEEEIEDLRAEAREKSAWESRYWALLEEAEASRPPVIGGGDASRGAADGTIVLDSTGQPLLAQEGGWWRLVKDVMAGKRPELHPLIGPYTIIHTPKEES